MKLLIRTDASVSMGTGHVMRCLALAQACQDRGGQAVFVMGESTPAIDRRLRAEKMDIVPLEACPGSDVDANHVTELALENQISCIVVDGYQFGSRYQRVIKGAGRKLLFIDDHGHAQDYSADIVLNQNAHAAEGLYRHRVPLTTLLLGLPYALLRREFRSWRSWSRKISAQGTKVLVTVGGSDSGNLTSRIIEGLQQVKLKGLQITVVVGGSNPHAGLLDRAVRQSSLDIRLAVDATNMPELMAWADIAIAAAGTVSWEICALGLPSILFPVAPNQRASAEYLGRLGAAKVIPDIESCHADALAKLITRLLQSCEDREQMSSIARRLVDGRGCERVMATLQELTEPAQENVSRFTA